jgi:uncharacterized protein (TIGR03437 family)
VRLDFAGGRYGPSGSGVGGFSFSFRLSDNDILYFTDPSTPLGKNSAVGNATLQFGTGAFNGATGSFAYTLECIARCETEDGVLKDGSFAFSFAITSGKLALPAGAPAALAQAVVNPPAYLSGSAYDYSVDYSGATITVTEKPQQNSQQQSRQASVAARTTAAAGDGTLTLTTVWQPLSATYSVAATCANLPAADCWVTIPTANATGTIAAFTSGTITANLNLPVPNAGVYPANVAITITPSADNGAQPPPSTLNVPLSLIVTSPEPSLTLSQSGLLFETGAGAPPAQSIAVSNTGSSALQFSAAASTLSGGNWLSVTTTSDATPAQVSITANPAGLKPGVYFGQVDFTSQGAANSPQSAVVALTVLSPSLSPAPATSPTGLIFVAQAGTNPPPQTVQVSNPYSQPVTVAAQAETDETTSWLSVAPATSTITNATPLTETLTVNTSGLAPGVYYGTLYQQVESGQQYPAAVLLVITASAPASDARPHTACAPTQLLPVFTLLGNSFAATAGLPVPLQVEVVDDCGAALTAGSVTATFSTGDPPVSLMPLGNGEWSATWMPHTLAGGSATITVNANSFTPELAGSTVVSGTLAGNTTAPLVNAGGVVSTASGQGGAPVAPGGFVSIYGSNLASATSISETLPYQTELAGTQVLLGGLPLPLEFVASGQINALVPFGVPVNTPLQLIVAANGSYALPETLIVAPAQPAVFTQNESGSGAGAILVVTPKGAQFLATASTPASAGDVLEIFCAGLGAVDPAVPDGSGAPSSTLSHTVGTVTATIGGQSAQVPFAGLAPGFAGLYQVNVTVPPGIAPGDNVPVILTVDGASSPPVTVAVQ